MAKPMVVAATVMFVVQTVLGSAFAEAVKPPITLPESVEPPRPWTSNVLPYYPYERLAAMGDRATVTLRVVVDRDGAVRDPRVVDGAEPFASAALKAVKRWHYEPAREEGRSIRVPWEIRIHFEPPPKPLDRWRVYRRENAATASRERSPSTPPAAASSAVSLPNPSPSAL